jgi:hypothetical protein
VATAGTVIGSTVVTVTASLNGSATGGTTVNSSNSISVTVSP